jgi:acyl-coenzyme A synthetase/AMP-(fatty) acid ligase
MAADFFAINERDRFAGFAPLHFDLSVFDIFAAVKMGASIVLVPEFLSTFPIKLAEYIEEKRVSIWNSASSALCLLADRGKLARFHFDSLRLIHFSGDIMPVKYLRTLMTTMKNAAFYNIYGQTEANSSMCYRVEDVPRDEAWKIPIGKAFPNFEVFALTEEGELVDRPGRRGELHVMAATVALGYWNDEERTKEKFIQDPRASLPGPRVYRTGDLVEVDQHNDYLFVGRKDHMVKSRGYRIELSEIEAVLHSHPSVRQAVVLAVPDELIGNRIVAHVGAMEGTGLSESDLVQFCANVLPKYMIPELIFFHDALPLTSSGKIDRKELEKAHPLAAR